MMKKTISAELFRQYVQQDELLFVEFHAPWCGYCRRIAPAVSRLEQRYGRQLQMVQINIDDEPALTDAERIELVPTFVLYRKGEALADLVAPQSYEQLEQLLLEYL